MSSGAAWVPHPGGVRARWPGSEVPAPGQVSVPAAGAWNWATFEVPPNANHSVIG